MNSIKEFFRTLFAETPERSIFNSTVVKLRFDVFG